MAQNFARDIPLSALIIRRLPKALRPILAPLITLPNKYHARKLRQHLKPLIESRVSKFDAAKEESQLDPNDFLQWSIRNAQTRISDAPEEMSTHFLALRLLALNFAAIHTSTITITNAIFDLASSDPSLQYLEQLREEAAYVLAEDNGMWSKRGLSRMHKIDSALRESLRLSGFVAIGLTRKVVAKNGVTTPEGVHLPFGAKVAVCAYGIHNDEKNYESPEVYDALRFVKQRQLVDEAAAPGVENYIKKANFSMVSTSTEYQAFGHGRHACPGRWLGAQELKAVLAYIVLNYDIEPLSERPRGKWMASTILPPLKATIKVRRRKV